MSVAQRAADAAKQAVLLVVKVLGIATEKHLDGILNDVEGALEGGPHS